MDALGVGVCFPVSSRDAATGNEVRSTSITGQAVLADAMAPFDANAAREVLVERNWRFRYTRHFMRMVEVSAESPECALGIARSGLKSLYNRFEFVRDGRTHTLAAALDGHTFPGGFGTGFIMGGKPKPSRFELGVPYNGGVLHGDALLEQIEDWVHRGTIEFSCGAAMSQAAQSGADWLDLSGRYFVLLGAGSAMGPLHVLLALGANVIAVARCGTAKWMPILQAARTSCGTLTFPLPVGKTQEDYSDDAALCEAAGCNLLTETPELRNWLLALHLGQPLCVGAYAYIPGEQFPRVALAMDVIVKALAEERQAAVAFLGTPTDVHLVPAAAHAAAMANYHRAPLWQKLLSVLSRGRWCAKNGRKLLTTGGETLCYCNALIVQQGPNYALAKRMQHWRAMVVREEGCIVSANIAPSTATHSVTQNRMFARAYASLPAWRPYEVPGPATSTAAMALLLLHDLNQPMHAGAPAMRLVNPLQLFSHGSFHGGTWRCAHTFQSIAEPAVALYYFNQFVVRFYLVMYNLVQTGGWVLVLVLALVHCSQSVEGSSAWAAFGAPLACFQSLAALEVVHSALGFVKSHMLTTALQVASRVGLVAVASRMPELHTQPSIAVFTLSWAMTEVVRYSWYATHLLSKPQPMHTWLRYSTFILLYPIGTAGELFFYYAAWPALSRVHIAAHATLGSILMYVVFPAYVPGLPFLYLHMFQQRSKALRRSASAESSRCDREQRTSSARGFQLEKEL